MPTPKVILLSQSKFSSESNPTPYPEEEYLSASAFPVGLTDPNRQCFRVNSAFKSCVHVFNS